jgi:hypothetical protein
MHLHLVGICRHNQNMIAIVTVRPNVILCREYPVSPQIAPSVFIAWENMTYWSKTCPISITFKLWFEHIFAKQIEQFLIEAGVYRRFTPIGGW